MPIQSVEYAHQAIDREPTEFGAADARNIGLSRSSQLADRDSRQLALPHDADQIRREMCLDVVGIGVGQPDIREGVARTPHNLNFSAH